MKELWYARESCTQKVIETCQWRHNLAVPKTTPAGAPFIVNTQPQQVKFNQEGDRNNFLIF